MTTKFQKPRPGIAFKNGKLYDFRARRIVVLRAWPEPAAWFRTSNQGWRASRQLADDLLVGCFGNLGRPAHDPGPLETFALRQREIDELRVGGFGPERIEERRVKAWKELRYAWYKQAGCIRPFIEQVPQEIRELIAPLHYRAWHLLCLMARCPGADDLFRSNPALAFALSGHWIYRDHKVRDPMRAARGKINKRQRDILAWMGFPGTKSTQHIFSKIVVDELHPLALRKLKTALRDPGRRKTLSHLPVITPEILAVLVDKKLYPRVGMPMLMEMAADRGRSRQCLGWLRDTLRMNEQRGGGYIPATFGSVRQLLNAHGDLVDVTNHLMLGKDASFPAPPYAGSADVQPITTLRELVDEGVQMRHCVASYADRIVKGSYYVYRVLKPVRATLGIRWSKHAWWVDELQGPGNVLIPRHYDDAIVESFFAQICLRGPLKRAMEHAEDDEYAYNPDFPPLHPEPDPEPPPPWVPCDREGHPVLLFSEESKAAVSNIVSIFNA